MKHTGPDEAKARERIAEAGFDYVGGFTGRDGTADIKCRKCGEVFKASYQPIRRRGSIVCPVCNEAARAEREELRRREETEKAEQRETNRLMRQEAQRIAEEEKAKAREQRRWKECKECGKKFYDDSYGGQKLYCSDGCSRKSSNRLKDARRRKYKSNGTLTKLYARDGGRCYLCGVTCDFNDYQIVGGAFVVGPTYPTVEHVIPICRGGDDGDDNIKLACHRCNSAKSIRSSYRIEKTGQIALVV